MGTNILIPIDNAGIGDAIAIKNNTTGEDKSHFICVVGSTVSATAPSGYTWYGTVYGRERGGLMIRSFSPSPQKWASTTVSGENIGDSTGSVALTHPNVQATQTDDGGLMRNGLINSGNKMYLAMNLATVISRNNVSGNTSTYLHPTTPLYGSGKCPMNKIKFDDDTNGAKTMYGTYENYISQLLPLMKSMRSGVFSIRCGRQNTKEMVMNPTSKGYTFPAAEYCFNSRVKDENTGHWWLPDMYELAVMMSDNSFEKCQYAHTIIGGNTAKTVHRWSSVKVDSTTAWIYHEVGISSKSNFVGDMIVCPVTLIPL